MAAEDAAGIELMEMKDEESGVMAAEDAAGIELMEMKDEESGPMAATDTARHTPPVTPDAHGKVDRVRGRVDHGADVKIKDKFGRTLLHKAAAHGSVDTVRDLVNRGAHVNVRDKLGWTPLHRAVYNDNFDTVMYLVEHAGADVNLKCENINGRTPLHLATNNGKTFIVKFLVDHGADVSIKDNCGGVPLHIACREGKFEIVQYLFDHGADVNAKDDDGRTALHWLFHGGVNSDILIYLVDHGAVVNMKDRTGTTPLHVGATKYLYDDDSVIYFVDHGTDVNIKNGYGRTALHIASEKGYLWVVQCLVDRGADINIKDDDGWTPLHLAAQSGSYDSLEMVKYLVDHGADVNNKIKRLWTPLHVASLNGHLDIVQYLVDNGVVDDWVEDVVKMLKVIEDNDVDSFHHHLERLVQDHGNIVGDLLAGSGVLHCAAKAGSIRMVEALIEKGLDVNTKSVIITDGSYIEWMTPLHVASKNGHLEVVQYLVDHGADVKIKVDDGRTPLHVAAENGKLNTVRCLVEHGANVNIKDNSNGTPMDGAARQQHLETVKYLVGQGAVVNPTLEECTPLYNAACRGNVDMVRFLADQGADINTKPNPRGWTPLHRAIEYRNPDLVRCLVDRGADVNIKDYRSANTPLRLAISTFGVYEDNYHFEIVEYLVDHGADVHIISGGELTSLHMAAICSRPDTIRYLQEHGADVNMKDDKGWTPLFYAAKNGSVDTVRCLVDLGADIKIKDEDGWTPLVNAAKSGSVNTVRYLVDLGADIKIEDEDGNIPLRLMISTFGEHEYNFDIVEYLVHHGADVHTKDDSGRTPLHMAAICSRPGTIRYLEEHGADVNMKDGNGWTPLLYAAKNGSVITVRCLVDLGADFKVKDEDGATPLHWACHSGSAKTVSYLVEKGSNPAAKDRSGKNSLSWAIQFKDNDVAATLLDYKPVEDHWGDWWKDSLRSSDCEGTTHMRDLIAVMPEVAEKVFSKCVKTNEGKQDEEEVRATSNRFRVSCAYEFLEDFQDSHSSDVENSADSWHPKKFTKYNHPLNLIMKHGRSNLLKHPLVITLLEYKWTKFGQYIFFANLFLYLVFLSFLTAFGLVVLSPLERTCVEVLNGSFNGTVPENCEGLSIHEYRFLFIGAAVTILTAVLRLALEILQLCRHPLEYLQDWVNWLEIPLYLFSMIFTFVFATPCLCVYSWQWQIGVVAVFLGWIGLITFLQKWPVTGVYVLMFVNIIQSFLKIAFLALLLVVAFALAFYMLLFEPDEMRNAFSHPGRAVVKVMSMTTGELDYDELYHQQEGEDEIAFPPVSFLLWITFLVLMPVLLSNLLVGLAVGDVDRLQKVATENRIELQIDLVLSIEELLEFFHLRQRFVIQESKFYPNTPETLLPDWCKRGTCDDDLCANKKPSNVRKWIAKLYSGWWIKNDYNTSGVNVSDAIKPPPNSIEEQLQQLEARLKEDSEQQSEQLDSKLKEMSEQLDSKLKERSEQLDSKLKERSEQLDSKLKEMSEQFQEQISGCHKEQASKMEEQTKKMEEQTERITEQLSGEVASLKEALEKLITQMATK